MTETPQRTLSIAMATYNGAAHLEEQLASIAQQSRRPDELVVCDDASTDATRTTLAAFAATAPFAVHVHHNDHNLGHDRNFERALSLCRGDLVLLCDQDDAWFPDKLARVERAFADRHGTAVVMVDQEVCDADLVPSGRTKLGNIRSSGLGISYYIPGCAAAMDRRWLDVALPIPEGVAYDTWIVKPAHHLGLVHIIDEPLQRYRRHSSNASNDVTSRATKVSRLDGVRGYHRAAALDAWRSEIRDNALIVGRLEDRAAVLAAAGWSAGLDPAIAMLRRRNTALGDRALAVQRDRHTRPMSVFSLLTRGGYDMFQGWRSAARDLVR